MDMPDTSELAPTDVVIRVKSTAIAFVDLIMMTGQYQHTGRPPYTPGLEYAGEVIWTGTAVDRFAMGDRLAIAFGWRMPTYRARPGRNYDDR